MEFINTYIIGPLGFIITIITLCLSIKIKEKVDNSLDSKELKEEYPEIKAKISNFISDIENKKRHEANKLPIRKLIYELKHKYPFFSEKKHNKKIIENILASIQMDRIDIEKLQENLIALDSKLSKVVR